MDLDVVFLGTGGSVPSARRATACILVRAGGARLLFDCGEGTQRQMQRSTGLVQVDEIYLTHYHADHYLGLPGLLKTYDLNDRQAPLRILGPPGLRGLFEALRRITGRVRYPLELVEIGEADPIRHDTFEIRPFAVEHRVRAYGYALVEDERPGRFDPDEAERLGVAAGPDFARLQAGETVDGADGPVDPGQVLGDARAGRKVVITGDTAPCEMTRIAAHEAELLVHDASFTDEELARAGETAHSTARQAARLAREAQAKALALVHISSRYHVGAVLDEARSEFPDAFAPRDFDLVEIPFPERGEPRLIENGARERPEPEPARRELTQRRGEVRDGLPDLGRVVLLQEVLGRQHDRVLDPQRPAAALEMLEAEDRVALAPDEARRIVASAQAGAEEPLLLLGQLEAAHDLQERAAAVAQPHQRHVGVDVGARDQRPAPRSPASRRSPRRATGARREARPRRSP